MQPFFFFFDPTQNAAFDLHRSLTAEMQNKLSSNSRTSGAKQYAPLSNQRVSIPPASRRPSPDCH